MLTGPGDTSISRLDRQEMVSGVEKATPHKRYYNDHEIFIKKAMMMKEKKFLKKKEGRGMKMKWNFLLIIGILACFPAQDAAAQLFDRHTGTDEIITVAQVAAKQLGSYVSVKGNIIAREEAEDSFTFQDETGTIRVEIPSFIRGDRKIFSETPIRLVGRIDRGPGGRYLYVESLKTFPY